LTELQACQANAECAAIASCAKACSDDPCVQACITQHPNGADDLNAYLGCAQQNCQTDCM
jgi:hypothetical protein